MNKVGTSAVCKNSSSSNTDPATSLASASPASESLAEPEWPRTAKLCVTERYCSANPESGLSPRHLEKLIVAIGLNELRAEKNERDSALKE